MRKNSILVIVLTVLSLSLVACGNGGTKANDKKDVTSNEAVTNLPLR